MATILKASEVAPMIDQMEERAIQYVMEFYCLSREVVCEVYWDEVEFYMRLMKFRGES